jgi:phosphomannomutase
MMVTNISSQVGSHTINNTTVYRFIFDVDGTLTPSRQQIVPKFHDWFLKFIEENYVYLVTGSDYSKTVYEQGKNIYTTEWTLPEDAHKWLKIKLDESRFVLRTGLHIEARPGMVNFSIVGRNATLGERKFYVKYDQEHNERYKLAKEFNETFPELQAVVGGETGLDIFQKGFDKSQIVKDFNPKQDILHFFGDAMQKGGNDYPLKKVLIDNDLGICYNIKDYKDTWKILKNEFST